MTDLTGPEADDDRELEELRALAGRLGGGRPEQWETPPADLWARIAADAGVPAAGHDGGPGDERRTEPGAGPATGPATPTTLAPVPPPVAPAGPSDHVGGGAVHRLDDRRRAPRPTRLPWVLAAAAAVVVVAVGAVAVLRPTTEDPTVLASAPLDQLADRGEGTAELVDEDGTLELHLETADLDPGDGFLEVWVIDTEVSKLVSLGPLRADGVYDLPDGLDPEAFPVVDVSVEPIDGDPAHSGDSVLRGQLRF